MIADYESLKTEVLDWMAREDLADKVDSFIGPTVADAATLLNIFVTETFMTQLAVEDQNTLIVPSGFNGILELYVGGEKYQRRSYREVLDGEQECIFHPYGEEIWFYPAAKLDQIIRMEYRGIQRDGASGTGVGVDSMEQLFSRRLSFAGVTADSEDAFGRFPFLLDEIKKPIRDDATLSTEDAKVDHVDRVYNAADRLIQRFPNVFLYGSLQRGYEYIQDEERAASYKSKYEEQINLAQLQLMQAKYGGARLRLQPRNRTLLQSRYTRGAR